MANININLSNSIIAALNTSGTQTETVADDLNLFFLADAVFSLSHQNYSNSSLIGGHLRLDYPDGASSTIDGVVLADPNAAVGAATATAMEEYIPQYYRLDASGQINYLYSASPNSVEIQHNGAVITSATLQTLLPTYSPNYDALLGNVTLGLQGHVQIDPSGNISGSVNAISTHAEKYLVSGGLVGNFNISGNQFDISQGGTTAVTGTVTGYSEQYADGSSISLTSINIAVTGATAINQALLGDGNNLPGDDVINIQLGGVPTVPWTIASGNGNDKVTIMGGGASLSVNAGNGNDTIVLGDDGHSVDGGAGTDTVVFSGPMSAYTVARTSSGYSVHANTSGATDTLLNVERLQFSDQVLALDVDGVGGQAYRLYQAAFNRAPDAAGLGFWIQAMDSGMSLDDVAAQFAGSKEFAGLYGANPSNADFLNSMYQNVLHRAGDPGGEAYWLDHLNAGDVTRPQVLSMFSESAENKAALIGAIANGFTYLHFG